MFCPGCGIEENQANQFCRACGVDLRPARRLLEAPDRITAAADSAREEIGRAFAAKIRQAQTGGDLKIIAEDVLPEIEKFLESPEQKRLRRMRTGTLIALIGLGAAIAFTAATGFMKDDGLFVVAALGIVAFFIGLSFIINGLLLTIPKSEVADRSFDGDAQRALDARSAAGVTAVTNDLALPEAREDFAPSVVEETTRHLKEYVPRR